MSFQAPFSTILRISKFQKCAKYDPNKSKEIANETPHKPLHICTASCNACGLKLYWGPGPCTVHASNPSWFKLVYLRKLIYAIESLNLCIYINIYINSKVIHQVQCDFLVLLLHSSYALLSLQRKQAMDPSVRSLPFMTYDHGTDPADLRQLEVLEEHFLVQVDSRHSQIFIHKALQPSTHWRTTYGDPWNRKFVLGFLDKVHTTNCKNLLWNFKFVTSLTLYGTIMDVENGFFQDFHLQTGHFPFIFHFCDGDCWRDLSRFHTYSSFLVWSCVQDTSFPHAPAESSAPHPSNSPPRSRKSAWKPRPPSP